MSTATGLASLLVALECSVWMMAIFAALIACTLGILALTQKLLWKPDYKHRCILVELSNAPAAQLDLDDLPSEEHDN